MTWSAPIERTKSIFLVLHTVVTSATNDLAICTTFKDGQEFILETNNTRPEGFCPWAFHDIFKDAHILMFGGNFIPWTHEGTMITCCSDGIRPVSFKLERMDD